MTDLEQHPDDGPPPDDLGVAYRSDPQQDALDLTAGWAALRSQLPPNPASRRRRGLVVGMAGALAMAATALLMVRLTPMASGPAPTALPHAPTNASAPAGYLHAVAELEAIVRQRHDRLPPAGVAAIEQSLAVVDRAIGDAAAAVAADPDNEYAAEWLATVRQRKLRALRQAVSDINLTS